MVRRMARISAICNSHSLPNRAVRALVVEVVTLVEKVMEEVQLEMVVLEIRLVVLDVVVL